MKTIYPFNILFLICAAIENGQQPNDIDLDGGTIQDICFNDAKQYFNWDEIV